MPEPTQLKGSTRTEQVLAGFAAVGMLAVIVWSSYWVFPNGKTWSIGDFILFWLREILFLCLIAGVILYVAALKLFKAIRRHWLRKRSAL